MFTVRQIEQAHQKVKSGADFSLYIQEFKALSLVAFASCLGKAKLTTGAEMYWWYAGFFVSLTVSMLLLIKATQTLPIGTSYAA